MCTHTLPPVVSYCGLEILLKLFFLTRVWKVSLNINSIRIK